MLQDRTSATDMDLPLHSPICIKCKAEVSACSCDIYPGKELVSLLADAKEPTSLDEGIALWAMHMERHPQAWGLNIRGFLKQLMEGGNFHKGLQKVWIEFTAFVTVKPLCAAYDTGVAEHRQRGSRGNGQGLRG